MKQTKKTGPALLPLTEKRTHCVSVRLNDDELDELDLRRNLAGGRMQRGAYLRAAAFRALPRPAVVPELNRQAWIELARAAANLNQIAAHLNMGQRQEVQDIKDRLAQFRAALIGAEGTG